MSGQKRYFDLTDDMQLEGRWHLRSPVDERGRAIDPWPYSEGHPVDVEGRIRLPVEPAGTALEFTLASFLIPVVHRRVVTLFERLGLQGEVQFVPVQVEGQSKPYFILNTLRTIRCIDDAR